MQCASDQASPDASSLANRLQRIGVLESAVIDLKHFPKGSSLGYHGTYRTKRDTLAAIVPIGTQDGFGLQVTPQPRFHQVLSTAKQCVLRKHATVAIEGVDYPILGVVDMSLCMVLAIERPQISILSWSIRAFCASTKTIVRRK